MNPDRLRLENCHKRDLVRHLRQDPATKSLFPQETLDRIILRRKLCDWASINRRVDALAVQAGRSRDYKERRRLLRSVNSLMKRANKIYLEIDSLLKRFPSLAQYVSTQSITSTTTEVAQ